MQYVGQVVYNYNGKASMIVDVNNDLVLLLVCNSIDNFDYLHLDDVKVQLCR